MSIYGLIPVSLIAKRLEIWPLGFQITVSWSWKRDGDSEREGSEVSGCFGTRETKINQPFFLKGVPIIRMEIYPLGFIGSIIKEDFRKIPRRNEPETMKFCEKQTDASRVRNILKFKHSSNHSSNICLNILDRSWLNSGKIHHRGPHEATPFDTSWSRDSTLGASVRRPLRSWDVGFSIFPSFSGQFHRKAANKLSTINSYKPHKLTSQFRCCNILLLTFGYPQQSASLYGWGDHWTLRSPAFMWIR